MSSGDWKDLIYAIQCGNLPLVEYHISQGVNPNYEHPELMTTPLIESISAGEVHITRYLLDHGADPKLKSGFKQISPINLAKKLKNQEILLLLRSYQTKSSSSLINKLLLYWKA